MPLLCGDSNHTIHPFLDQSPTPPTAQGLSFQHLLNQHALLDSWREQNPARHQYTHYSYPHKQFSRIDYILINISSSLLILTSTTAPCSWSDHNAVITFFSSLIPKPNHHTWTINDSLLTNPTHHQDIENAINYYLSNNCTPDVSPLTLWEAHKQVIRGICISHISVKRSKFNTND